MQIFKLPDLLRSRGFTTRARAQDAARLTATFRGFTPRQLGFVGLAHRAVEQVIDGLTRNADIAASAYARVGQDPRVTQLINSRR
jgi:hypothetical protein